MVLKIPPELPTLGPALENVSAPKRSGCVPKMWLSVTIRSSTMRNGNVIRNIYETGEKQRISIYYDRRPTTSAERDRRICMVLKSSGQVIRFSEAEALELVENVGKVLKRKIQRSWH
jgi:hypothetical protein